MFIIFELTSENCFYSKQLLYEALISSDSLVHWSLEAVTRCRWCTVTAGVLNLTCIAVLTRQANDMRDTTSRCIDVPQR